MGIFDYLLRHPILLFVIAAWLIGTISNVLKAKEKARRSRPAQPTQQAPLPQRPTQQPLPMQRQPPAPQRQSIPSQRQPMPQPVTRPAPAGSTGRPQGAKSAEDIAREMRRILGLDPDPTPPRPAPAPSPPPVPVEVTPPPRPLQIATKSRKLELHSSSHVGDQIRGRRLQSNQPRIGTPRLGDLGGRAGVRTRRRKSGSRFALDDLKRAFVLSEILAPPVALRPFEERRPH